MLHPLLGTKNIYCSLPSPQEKEFFEYSLKAAMPYQTQTTEPTFLGTCFQDVLTSMQKNRDRGPNPPIGTTIACESPSLLYWPYHVISKNETDLLSIPGNLVFDEGHFQWGLYFCLSPACTDLTTDVSEYLGELYMKYNTLFNEVPSETAAFQEAINSTYSVTKSYLPHRACFDPFKNTELYCSGESNSSCTNKTLIDIKTDDGEPFELAICDDCTSQFTIPYLRAEAKMWLTCDYDCYEGTTKNATVAYSDNKFNSTAYCSAATKQTRIDGGDCVVDYGKAVGQGAGGKQTISFVDIFLLSSKYQSRATISKLTSLFKDPHFRTFNNQHFSFHGQCDLVLTRSKKSDFDIHLRTTRVHNPRADYSYISGAAVRIGQNVIEIDDRGNLIINGIGEVRSADNDPLYLGELFPRLTKTLKGDKHKIIAYNVDLGDENKIDIRVNMKTGMLFVDVTGTFEDSEGLLGSDPKYGKPLLSRDGVTDLTGYWNTYGQEWQVNNSDQKLFQDMTRRPQFPETCSYHADTESSFRGNRRRLSDTPNVSLEVAESACVDMNGAKKKFCIEDVMAVGDVGIAEDPFYTE